MQYTSPAPVGIVGGGIGLYSIMHNFYGSAATTVAAIPSYYAVDVGKSTLVTSAMADNTDFSIRMMCMAWYYSETKHEWWINLSHTRGLLLLKIFPKGGCVPSTYLAEAMVEGQGPDSSMWPDEAVISYAQNRLTQEEYFHVDAFTFVKHRFKYGTYFINYGTLFPQSDSQVGTIMIGGLNVMLDDKSLKHTDYHLEPSTEVDGATIPAYWKFDKPSGSSDKVHVAAILNPIEHRKETSQDSMLYDESQYSFDQTYCAAQDAVIAVAEETAIFEIDHDSEWIIMGLNSQRGVVDSVFDSFADACVPWLAGSQGASQPSSVEHVYYSVVMLLSNASTPKRTPKPSWNTGIGDEHHELFWMGTVSQMTIYNKYWHGPRTEVLGGANRSRSELISKYSTAASYDWKYVFLKTTVKADFSATYPGRSSSALTNASVTHTPFPFGSCTSTPTAFHVTGTASNGTSVIDDFPMQLSALNITTQSVSEICSMELPGQPMCHPKVHLYKDHLFCYTNDTVFAFDPTTTSGSIDLSSLATKATCSFVAAGVGTHRYVDRFDSFIEQGFGDYILSQT